jgi:hypothetical protein
MLAAAGCTGITTLSIKKDESAEEGAPRTLKAVKNQRYLRIERSYSMESLLLHVLQHNNLALSFDYFPQFLSNGDFVFPEYLHRIFGSEHSPFRPGQGVVVTAGYEGDELELIIERALLSRDAEGNEWWQVKQTYFGESIMYEVLVSRLGVPQLIRYQNTETGGWYESVPSYAAEYTVLERGSTPAELEVLLGEKRDEENTAEMEHTFNQPAVVGEELIEAEAGKFMAVHVADTYDDEYATGADYWISPDVPGGIIRIIYSSPGQTPYVVELDKITTGNNSIFREFGSSDKKGDSANRIYSEGSAAEPMELFAGDTHIGTAGHGQTSYYRFIAEQRADYYIDLNAISGVVEIFYYGEDPTYRSIRRSEHGPHPVIEAFFVDPGTALHFSVRGREHGDEGSLKYSIDIRDEVLLSPTGVLLRGEIFRSAEERKPDRSHTEFFDFDGLNYYRTRVVRGRHLRITAINLPPAADMFWADARGSSDVSAYAYRENGVRHIEVNGVMPGTECYFYVVGDRSRIAPDTSFTLLLEQQSR